MKLHYIGILRNDSKPAVELCSEMELSTYSRFTRVHHDAQGRRLHHERSACPEPTLISQPNWIDDAVGSYAEFMTLFSKKVAESTRPGQRQDIEEGDNTFHCVGRSEGICGV
ncbi:LOW QUALITY PROTEIN: SNARE Ykt6 [Colletotrichum tofieldiae]|nr:LOW QUALITY PROTEIN: SNARE Ykt6 [Colletotrichum tofieldiae]GKT80131.1 LOW QUALITY PROTEIN: SNARE Ykt6 [Colletotrichum tofieldiae]GKT85303.1 LOW QUALITY PROTEIN: SNARE Ykt6 [Colletotrichum tofieldiae]